MQVRGRKRLKAFRAVLVVDTEENPGSNHAGNLAYSGCHGWRIADALKGDMSSASVW